MWRVIALATAVIVLLAVLLGIVFHFGLRRIQREDQAAAAAFAFAKAHAPSPTTRPDAPLANGLPQAAKISPIIEPRPEAPQAAPVAPITLSASAAQLTGSEIRIQQGREPNIGFWHHTTESAGWKADVPKPGVYHVQIVYACAPGNGGGVYEMQIGQHRFTGTSTPTGSWDDYNTLEVGDLTLTAGEHPIALKPLTLNEGRALMNVRSVRLVAVK